MVIVTGKTTVGGEVRGVAGDAGIFLDELETEDLIDAGRGIGRLGECVAGGAIGQPGFDQMGSVREFHKIARGRVGEIGSPDGCRAGLDRIIVALGAGVGNFVGENLKLPRLGRRRDGR